MADSYYHGHIHETHLDAFGHLKAMAADAGAQALLKQARVKADAGVVGADDPKAFVAAARTRQWAREPSVRTLA